MGLRQVLQLIENKVSAAKRERKPEHLIQQTSIADVDPDVGVADVDRFHAATNTSLREVSRTLIGFCKNSAALDLLNKSSASPQKTRDSKR